MREGFVSIFKDPDEIEFRARAEGGGGHGLVGDGLYVLKPGDGRRVFGWTYEELLEHGEGVVELKETTESG